MKRLSADIARRVRDALAHLAETGQGDVKQLKGIRPPQWRLRVGDWRVRFRYHPDTRTLEVLRVLPRGEAYR